MFRSKKEMWMKMMEAQDQYTKLKCAFNALCEENDKLNAQNKDLRITSHELLHALYQSNLLNEKLNKELSNETQLVDLDTDRLLDIIETITLELQDRVE